MYLCSDVNNEIRGVAEVITLVHDLDLAKS